MVFSGTLKYHSMISMIWLINQGLMPEFTRGIPIVFSENSGQVRRPAEATGISNLGNRLAVFPQQVSCPVAFPLQQQLLRALARCFFDPPVQAGLTEIEVTAKAIHVWDTPGF